MLEDQFGDGWGAAKLILLSSSGRTESATLSCNEQDEELKYCFSRYSSSASDYLVATVVGVPSKPWEVVPILQLYLYGI